MMSRFRKRRHSLSARLVVLFVVMTILFMVLVGGSMRFAFRSNFMESIRPHLFRYMEYIRQDIGTPPNFARASEIVKNLPVEVHIINGEQHWSSTGKRLELNKIRYFREFRENGVEYALGEFEGQDFLVRKNLDYTLAFSILHPQFSWSWMKAVPLVIALVLLVVLYHATRRIFSPIGVIKEGVEKIGEGDLQHRIQVNRRDELGDLSTSINRMADDIQQMLEAKRQLLLAISHELRSPMTRMKVSLELLEDKDKREAINHDLTEMDNLIAELLETERLSKRHSALNKTRASLTGLVRELIKESFKETSVEVDMPESDVWVHVDAIRIKLLLKNLLENALRYSPTGADPPRLSLNETGERVVVAVQDYGKGVEEKHIPFLTEPFYRVDPARQRKTGGYGLGLYLCRIIAETHGGRLHISSENQKGTQIKVELPKNED